MTAPNDEGVQRCIRSAVADARIQPEAIDYINGHLTATFADSVELMNWSRALEVPPEHMPPVNATKSLIGHSLGAAGAIECIATILQMKDGFIHGSMNCENLHPDAGRMASSIVRETKTRNIQIAAKAGFGFGDVNSCIIFKNAEAM